jgi:glycosyltransferase involved in cell wall biosynthesis
VRVAHVAIVTPHRAGLYETARDLAAAERRRGVDALIIDPKQRVEGNDRGVPIVGPEFGGRCDVLINHSGLSGELNGLDKPIIHMLHGRPYSTFLLEQQGKGAVYSFWRKMAGDPRYKRYVTFWSEFLPYFENVLPPNKLRAIPPPVDLGIWTPKGPSGYRFHGHKGEINIVVTDIWREDKDPYHILNAFLLFTRKIRKAKLHIYAAPQKGTAWGVLKALLRESGCLGECVGFVKGLDNVYRAADAMITPHRIATRSVREALACGCNVVMGHGQKYTPFRAEAEDLGAYARQIGRALKFGDRKRNRIAAEHHFDSAKTAGQLIDIMQEVLDGSE